jgi:hypothetical protein
MLAVDVLAKKRSGLKEEYIIGGQRGRTNSCGGLLLIITGTNLSCCSRQHYYCRTGTVQLTEAAPLQAESEIKKKWVIALSGSPPYGLAMFVFLQWLVSL